MITAVAVSRSSGPMATGPTCTHASHLTIYDGRIRKRSQFQDGSRAAVLATDRAAASGRSLPAAKRLSPDSPINVPVADRVGFSTKYHFSGSRIHQARRLRPFLIDSVVSPID
jgi:hypothetical protein